MSTHYSTVALRANHRCEYCHAPEVIFNFPFEVEHILPRLLEGQDIDINLALACRSCNLWKATHVRAIDPETAQDVRLFHPREDHWDDHFMVDTESGIIQGRTALGRATIACLRINMPMQQAARRQWMQLGLFP